MFDTHLASLAIAALTVAFLAQLTALVWLTSAVIRQGRATVPAPLVKETPAQRVIHQPAPVARQPLTVVPPLKQHAYDDGPDAVSLVVGDKGESAQVAPPRVERTSDLGGGGFGDAAEQMWEDVRAAQDR